jgi:hypothetical protein
MSLFNLKNNQVVIEPDVLGIPEFKKLWDKDKSKTKDEAYKQLSYIFYVYDFNSPYSGTDERKRSLTVIKDFIKDESWTPGEDVIAAAAKYRELSETPLTRLLDAVKLTLDKMTDYLRGTEVNDETVRIIVDTVNKTSTIVGSYFKLKDTAQKEISSNSRTLGNKIVSDYER